MKAVLFLLFWFGPVAALWADEATVTDGEVWNAGVEFYAHGDVTNALRVLRPLMESKTHGARAAEVVAKLEYDRGNREEAAAAAQRALRAQPADAKANRNFTRAIDGLLEARKNKHVENVLKAAQGKGPDALLAAAMRESRQLLLAAGNYRTNEATRAVVLADQLSQRAEKLADVWIPVREAIVQSVTNEDQAATIVAQVQQAQDKTQEAARLVGDLADGGFAAMSDVEHDCTRFLKMTALPPTAIDEGLIAQSNAWMSAEPVNDRSWQRDALDFTRSFRAKFPAWARAYEQRAQADTNAAPFSAEDQAKISALATEVEKLQLECVEKNLPPQQEKAIRILSQIRELLPKDRSGSGQQQPPPQQNPQSNQQQNPQSGQDQQQDSSSDQQADQQPDQGAEEQGDQSDQADAEQNEEQERQDQEIDAVLKKAQERNDEHEAKKRALMRKAPLPPNERDW